ncbi:hypothetical protein LTR48_001502 [Friedmanniomyces endolithicus]|uniref:Uncharacterized protein n=2 Tax=Dothideomycetidae TaxID=451867 RepID=A0A4U0VB35_9PEZI|nr:hypothetical protein LTS09_005848 [Friedmanniomyces endolithicus]KAK5145965.1 hypothetical protein LTR32_002375 [Rachicladosporium monterosium]KAK0934879.1 hypothetical protein LTR29_013523 [Friedmanniomyces endolithicus]KAK1088510.1 hypothetical protein LTR48_001502 [Friedmanniomyces endolithicus]KAK1822572.1 hypothetical protein LTR12_002919 [Friedmanniomyces endolithicus]
MSSEDSTAKDFTSGETKILMCIIKHLKGEINSDFGAVASELGYKDASIAKTRLRQIIAKKIEPTGSAGGGKATPRKRKGAAEGGDNDTEESPTKKCHGAKPKRDGAKAGSGLGIKKEEAKEEADAMVTAEGAGEDVFT